MSQQLTADRPSQAAVASFACLLLLGPWLFLCRLQAAGDGAPLGWMLAFCAGAGALSALGVAFGVAARQSGWGLLALALNGLILLYAAAPLLMLLGGWE